MTHPFEAYYKRKGHYPRVKLDNGYQTMLVEFMPGYVRVAMYPSGSVIWIRRSTFLNFLRRTVPIARQWKKHPDHDVPKAMHESYLQELILSQERRELKKGRVFDLAAQAKKKRRHQRARERALRQRSDDEAH